MLISGINFNFQSTEIHLRMRRVLKARTRNLIILPYNDAIHHLDKLDCFRALVFELFSSKFGYLVFKPRGYEFKPDPTHPH